MWMICSVESEFDFHSLENSLPHGASENHVPVCDSTNGGPMKFEYIVYESLCHNVYSIRMWEGNEVGILGKPVNYY